jgi:hypothetical protein
LEAPWYKPLNALVKKTLSSTVPTNAFAPKLSIAATLDELLVITDTSFPASTNDFASGLLMLPKEPVMTIFILIIFKFKCF